jgi:hypothetical protein
MFDRRLQVRIDQARWSRLQREASRRGVPAAQLVRQAIDRLIPQPIPRDTEERRSALQAILDPEPMALPSPASLRQELDQIRSGGPS